MEIALDKFASYKFVTAGSLVEIEVCRAGSPIEITVGNSRKPVEIEVCRVGSSNSGSAAKETNQTLDSIRGLAKP